MAFFSKSQRNWTKKYDFIEGFTEWSPTEYAKLTEFITEFFPTEYAELTEFTAEYSPTDFRCNFRGCTCLKCTNQANSDPPTDFRSTQMVRVRIIKTTKYAHVKDGVVADSLAVEHNVLATFFPTLFHRRRTESNRTANGI